MFIGRDQEIAEIRSALSNKKFESFLIYGRRRVGKTELIREAINEETCKIISYECKRASLKTNISGLSRVVCNALNLPGNIEFKDLESIIDTVFRYSLEEKIIFIIDEFSFLLAEDSCIDSIFSVAIDKYKKNSQMKLFISGSILKLMTELVDGAAPLYGRFSHIMQIKVFDYYTSSMFYKNYTDDEKLLMYSVFGGVAYFNSLIDPELSAEENILNLVVKRDSILEHEINEMILSETNKSSGLNTIINILGKGISKYSDIVSHLSNQKDKPDYALNRLIEMEIITKIIPINEPNSKRHLYYSFSDNLIHFYFRYIFENTDSRNIMSPKAFFDNFIKDDLQEVYLPAKFEQITKQYLIRQNIMGKFNPPLLRVGTYFYNDSRAKISRQFDVVTEDKKGFVAYECKYTNKNIGLSVINEEIEQTKLKNIVFYKLGFVAKTGFTEKVNKDDYITLTLSDLYK